MPKLSVITINLNNFIGLEKTIKSVLQQTYSDFEYLIIDGGSNDDSIKIIKAYSEKITYWVSEPDKGIYCAMNKGINKAKGEYCLFLNSGDYLFNSDVLKNVFKMSFPEDIIIGSIILNGKDKQEKLEIPEERCLTFRHMINSTLPHQGAFIKRNLFDKFGFYIEGSKLSSDWEFFLIVIFKHGVTLRKTSEVISVYDWNGISSLPENVTVIQKERKEILEKHFPRFFPDYEYFTRLELDNRELEYKTQNSFIILLTKIIKGIKKSMPFFIQNKK